MKKAEEVIATRDVLGIESRGSRNAGIEVDELVRGVVVGMWRSVGDSGRRGG